MCRSFPIAAASKLGMRERVVCRGCGFWCGGVCAYISGITLLGSPALKFSKFWAYKHLYVSDVYRLSAEQAAQPQTSQICEV